MPFSGSPFKDAVQPTQGGFNERPNLGTSPDAPTSGKTGEASFGGIKPTELPLNDLHHGTPDRG